MGLKQIQARRLKEQKINEEENRTLFLKLLADRPKSVSIKTSYKILRRIDFGCLLLEGAVTFVIHRDDHETLFGWDKQSLPWESLEDIEFDIHPFKVVWAPWISLSFDPIIFARRYRRYNAVRVTVTLSS